MLGLTSSGGIDHELGRARLDDGEHPLAVGGQVRGPALAETQHRRAAGLPQAHGVVGSEGGLSEEKHLTILRERPRMRCVEPREVSIFGCAGSMNHGRVAEVPAGGEPPSVASHVLDR